MVDDANLDLAFFFSSTVIGGIVVNLVSIVNGIVFSTFFSGAAEGEAEADEEDADDDTEADSVSRGGVCSADSAEGSPLAELPEPNSPFSLPGNNGCLSAFR